MNLTLANIVIFVLVSVVWWVIACCIMLMAIIGPCGMGPDATCDVTPYPALLAFGGAAVGYAGLAILILRRRGS